MVAAKIKGIVSIPASEASNIRALEYGALSVAFEVTNRFQTYSRGIFKDTTCNGRPNHAVTAVGYTPEFVLVKNSWGTDYRAGDNDDAEPEPTCENSYKGTCYERWCRTEWIAEDYCQRTCNRCPCPSGTTRCPDGFC